jgi:flagellar biosynthesis chaperone FliJ
MKRIQGKIVSLVSVFAILFATAAIRAEEGSKKITVGLKEIHGSIANVQAGISSTMSALSELKSAGKSGSSLSAKHAAFNKQFQQLQSTIEDTRKQGTLIRGKSEEQYKAWQEELAKMGNPKLRDKAMNRYEDAKEEFEEIIVISQEAKKDLGNLMSDLNDIATYLNTDLSKDALKTLSNTIWKLENKSRGVVASLQHVNTQIDRTLEELPEGK